MSSSNNEKTKENKEEYKSKKEKYESNALGRWIVISTTIIILANISFLVFLILLSREGDMKCIQQAAESSLLSTGISIIGIVVAVWAGLGISNAISQNRVDSLENKVGEIDNCIAEKLNDLPLKVEEVEKNLNNISTGTKRLYERFADLFLEELLKLASIDLMNKYFYDRFFEVFSESTDRISNISELIEIEQLFLQVYSLHDIIDIDDSVIRDRIEQGLNKINNIWSTCSNDIVLTYLRCRRADFNFYSIYTEYFWMNIKEIKVLTNTLDDFFQVEEKICGQTMPEMNEQFNVGSCYADTNELQRIKIYYANTIGEYYSKIVEKLSGSYKLNFTTEKKVEYGVKAIFYLKCAAEWECNSYIKPEVYYRNLACAYIRFDRLLLKLPGDVSCGVISKVGKEHSAEILNCYKKAFNAMTINERPARVYKLYSGLMRYYKGFFENIIEKHKSDDYDISENEIKELAYFYHIAEIAKAHFPNKKEMYEMNKFIYLTIVYFINISSSNIKLHQILIKYFCNKKESYLDLAKRESMQLQLLFLKTEDFSEEIRNIV